MSNNSAPKKRSDEYHIGENARHYFKSFNGVKLAKDGKPRPHPHDRAQLTRFPERQALVVR